MTDNKTPDFSEELAAIFQSHGQQLTPEELARISNELSDDVADLPEPELEDDTSDELDENEEEDLEEDSEEEGSEEEPEEDAPPKKPIDKKDRTIIALKAQRKAMRELLKSRETPAAKPVEDYAKDLLDKNFDEDAAQVLAQSQSAVESLRAEVELLRFESTNRSVLEKYDGALEDVALIMSRVKATGMTAEQICHAMYDALEPEEVRRQRASARGERRSEPKPSDYTVSNVVGKAGTKPKISLTREENRLYEQLEQLGIPNLTKEEFIASRRPNS